MLSAVDGQECAISGGGHGGRARGANALAALGLIGTPGASIARRVSGCRCVPRLAINRVFFRRGGGSTGGAALGS